LGKNSREELLLYSAHEEDDSSHTEGVALILSEFLVKGWEAHGPRVLVASF
jgi:hypothetical protein